INTYLSVIDRSDDALKMLISYFESVEEDTIILIYGDHQPMVDKSFYENIYNKPYSEFTLEELKEVYALPYLIWANYDLNEDAAPAETSNCYLSTILFEVGNIPKSTWLNMVEEYRKEYPIVSTVFVKEADGDLKTKDSILKDVTLKNNLLKEYQNYSYGILYGLKE
ncbi:MAG: sulfatase-like hydrolase/transferase, partial [Clostridia bacterium]|nr:sulfatase-like hydrolase/transferase [Clostridia bacterium]